MLPVVVENLLVGAAGLALLFYLGGGLALLLPASLLPYRWLLAPWLGYSLLVVLTQFLTNVPLEYALTALDAAYVALGLVTVLYAYVGVRLLRRPGVSGLLRAGAPDGRYLWWVALLSVGVFALCLLPLWSYGYTTVIGENWDAEIYMGLGEYLKDFAQTALTFSAPNPILDTLVNPPYGLRTHGFSYFQAALGFLPLDSLQTLPPVLALMRALSIPAAYVFFRVGMGLRPAASLPACAALGLNAFLLWVTYNTFGMQVPAFGLLPAAVCATLVTVRGAAGGWESPGAEWKSIALTALLVAATAVTYHPALTAYLALAGPAALAVLVLHRRDRGALRVLGALGTAGVLAVLLSFVSQVKSLDGFLKQYGERVGGLGLTGFTSPADAFGFSLSFRDLLPPDPGRPLYSLLLGLYAAAGWLALAAAVALIALYLYSLRPRPGEARTLFWETAAMLAGAGVYVLLFLWPLDYPYGWFKALSFMSFVLIGAAVGGTVAQSPKSKVQGSIWRRWTLDFRLWTFAAVLLVTTALTVRMYWGEPLRFSREMLEVGAVRQVIADARGQKDVYVSSSPNMKPLGRLYNGLLSYYLRYTDLYGTYETANSQLDREKPSGVYRFALLHAGDRPSEFGVAGGKLAWHNSLMSLYELPPPGERAALYHHNYTGEDRYPAVSAGASLFAAVESAQVMLEGAPPPEGSPFYKSAQVQPLQFELGFAALTTATLRLQTVSTLSEGWVEEVTVPPGYTSYRSNPLISPAVVQMSVVRGGAESDSVYVRWAHLERGRSPGGERSLSPDGDGLLARIASSQNGEQIMLDLDYLNNRPGTVSQTLSLDIYGSGRGNAAHFGYWNLGVPANIPVSLQLQFDPAAGTLGVAGGSQANLTDSFRGETGDGGYTASLLVYEGGQVVETFNDVFTFTIEGGKLESFRPRELPPLFR